MCVNDRASSRSLKLSYYHIKDKFDPHVKCLNDQVEIIGSLPIVLPCTIIALNADFPAMRNYSLQHPYMTRCTVFRWAPSTQ